MLGHTVKESMNGSRGDAPVTVVSYPIRSARRECTAISHEPSGTAVIVLRRPGSRALESELVVPHVMSSGANVRAHMS